MIAALASLPGIGSLAAYPFFLRALLAGGAVAVASGFVGYFLVLRGQVFTSDALGHVAFTGAAAALAFGLDVRLGLFVATVGLGVAMGLLGERGRADDVVIGNVLAWVLGLGVLFLSLFLTHSSGGNGTAGVTVLFGSVFGLSTRTALSSAAISIAAALVLLGMARPLMFASLDSTVAAARGVSVRLLGVAFLALVGVVAAEATQVLGALLLLGLLAAPAGTAQRLTARPYRALFLSAGIALLDMWGGLALSLAIPRLPPSFSVIAVATALYAAVFVGSIGRDRRRVTQPAAAIAVGLLALAALLALTLAGCGGARTARISSGATAGASAGAVSQPAPDPKLLVGRWRAADTAGKEASLSDLTLYGDGTFRYAGRNALGGPVAFGGTYQSGVLNGAPWMRLVYDDYPDKPTVWFYQLAADKLSVSSVRGNLANGSALVFTKLPAGE